MTCEYQTSKEFSRFQNSQISRRRLLQLIGYSVAGITGTSILAACGGPNPPHPINITTTPSGTVTSSLGATRQVTPYFLGYNNVPIHSPSWQNPDVVKAAVQFKPGTLRYPGGTVANYWDWRSGWFLPGAPGGFLNAPLSIYRLQELQLAVQATGAIPIYVLNMLTSDLNTQLEMLSTAQSMGLPVQFVELGNEFYLMNPADYVTQFPTGADYGKIATSWIQGIRAKFPKVNIGVVGSVPTDQSSDARKANWNQELLQNLEGADALTQHPYVSVTHNMIVNGSDTESAMNIVDAISTRWQQFESQLQSLPQNMKVWFTEYNLVDPTNAVFYTWIHGISAAIMSLTFLEEERSELACFYDMIGKSGYEVISSNQQFALTAAGWAMRLLGDTMRNLTSARAMDFGVNSVSNSGISSPPLQGWIFTDGTHNQSFIVNSSATSFTWTVDPIFTQGTRFQQLSSDPFKRITGSSSLTINSGTLSNQLSLPAYSLTQLK